MGFSLKKCLTFFSGSIQIVGYQATTFPTTNGVFSLYNPCGPGHLNCFLPVDLTNQKKFLGGKRYP